MGWIPYNDGYGIIGYSWMCECGRKTDFASPGDTCACGRSVSGEDPDDWYDGEMGKPVEQREWNRLPPIV